MGELVTGHRPVRPLAPPLLRATGWFLLALIGNVILIVLVQPFRPGFLHQLVEAPRLLMEVGGGLLSVASLAYLVLAATVPGEQVSWKGRFGIAALVLVFIGSVLFALVTPSPEPSHLGARLACNLEVLIYGSISMIFLLFVARRGYLRPSLGGSMAFGLTAGLMPATLMQIACLYDPLHALTHHYGPIILLAVVGVVLGKRLTQK